jgi:RES domain-containing protein
LIDAGSIPSTHVRGTWWRIGHPGADPLALTPEPADGRWQRGHVIRALYLADSEETAWAEWYRHSSELGVPPQTRLPRDMYRFAVDLDNVADLTARGVLERLGLTTLAPTRRQWPKAQPVGEACWQDGRVGLIAPSAAHAEGRVLAVFRPNRRRPTGIRSLPPARRHTELPALPVGLRT